MARLFVAVRPPPATLDLIASLPRPDRPDLRWTPRDQWHVTLAFLADAPQREVARRLDRLVAPVVVAHIPPRPWTSRTVWALPVDGLDSVAAAVHQVLDLAADRPFRGHLTLARSRSRRVPGPGVQLDPARAARPEASFAVTHVELVRSELRSAGARHTVVAVVALDPPDRVPDAGPA